MIKLTQEQVHGLIHAIENPNPLQTQITLMFLRSLLEIDT
jgi:hypothetical protein